MLASARLLNQALALLSPLLLVRLLDIVEYGRYRQFMAVAMLVTSLGGFALTANLTYLLSYPTVDLVLRRPPLGPVAPGAHDMGREYQVLSRLGTAFPPAPRALLIWTGTGAKRPERAGMPYSLGRL